MLFQQRRNKKKEETQYVHKCKNIKWKRITAQDID